MSKKLEELKANLNDNIPKHVAIIMDGNGRWAKKRFMPRIMGHRQGVKTVKRIVEIADVIGVKYLTLYAFSTENWKRPNDEVSGLWKLMVEFLKKEVKNLDENNVRMATIGDTKALPEFAYNELMSSIEKLSKNTGLTLNLALNYSSKFEILNAVNNMIQDGVKDVDESIFDSYLYTKDMPQVDLIIRTSGEIRLSNFLLWQSAYSELIFNEKFWPAYKKEDFVKDIIEFQKRDRRFGGIKK